MRALTLLALLTLVVTGVVANPNAERVIHEQAEVLLERIAKASRNDANPDGLEDLVAEIIAPHVDFTLFSRLVLGKHWRNASIAERQRLEKGLTSLVLKTYSTALAGARGLEITYLNAQQEKRPDRVVVPTVVKSADNPAISLSYKLYEKDGVWKVYDVVIEGISMALNYRSVLAERIKREGMQSVINSLASNAATLREKQ